MEQLINSFVCVLSISPWFPVYCPWFKFEVCASALFFYDDDESRGNRFFDSNCMPTLGVVWIWIQLNNLNSWIFPFFYHESGNVQFYSKKKIFRSILFFNWQSVIVLDSSLLILMLSLFHIPLWTYFTFSYCYFERHTEKFLCEREIEWNRCSPWAHNFLGFSDEIHVPRHSIYEKVKKKINNKALAVA